LEEFLVFFLYLPGINELCTLNTAKCENMKKVRNLLLFFLFLFTSTSSCELLEDCKTCSLVTYINGEKDGQTEGVLYCGDELKKKEKSRPVVDGNMVTQWECF